VIPGHLVEAVNKIQDTNLICPPAASQVVACAALGAGAAYCRERVGELAGARLLVLEALAGVADRCTVPRPDGAFYCLARVHTSMDPLALVDGGSHAEGFDEAPALPGRLAKPDGLSRAHA